MPRSTKLFARAVVVVVGLSLSLASSGARAERIRDLAEVAGARENQLIGYGIVTGLSGTGDDLSAPFASQSVLSLLRRLGVQADARQVRLRNVAAVVVTAKIPAFAKPGTKIDITVSSIGNAKSIAGGVLVQTLLKGADQKTYAVAQGSVLTGSISAGGASGSSVKTGIPTTGRVPEGALVEREIAQSFVNQGVVRLQLRSPSFGVAARMSDAINKVFGQGAAEAKDGGSVAVKVPRSHDGKSVAFVSALEDVEVATVRRARVVVSERTQTIVAGGDVRLSPAVVVHGGITVVVKEAPLVSQPGPLAAGKTAVVPGTEVTVAEADKGVRLLAPAASLSDVATGLGSLGLNPRELAGVLEALRTAGALEAEVVVQ